MNTRTPVYREIIEHPAAWTRESIPSKNSLVFDLTPEHLDVIDGLMTRTRHLSPQEVTRHDFSDPVIDEVLAELRDVILQGRGTVVIRGITPERYTAEDFERIYWGLGTHWGEATIQSISGDRLAHVKHYKDNPHARGYRSADELQPHTDSFEIVGLMCVQRAESGGHSRLVSTLAIHNEILKTRPELLEPLYRGVPNSVLEARNTADAVTKTNIPVFSNVNGQVSCLFSRMFIEAAVKETGVPLPDDFAEAAAYFEQLAHDDRFRLEFMLEPGEMFVWNNFVVLHSRTKFEDSAERQRDLLRLWLNVQNGRPVSPELFTWARIYEELFRQRIAAAGSAVAGGA
jgi:hypothetical protein